MIDLTQKGAYIVLMKSLLLYQFKGAENLNKLLTIWGGNLNASEDLLFNAISSYFWENAQGAQLDTLGKIIGITRQGRTDTNYKTVLQLKIRLNVSAGEIPVLMDALEILFNATFIQYVQDFGDDRPVAKIITDGEVNLFTEFQAITEDGLYNLAFDIKDDNNIITEDGNYIFVTENGLAEFSMFGTVTEYGADAILTESDTLDETVLYNALPAGVGLYFMSYLTDEDGATFFTDEKGNFFIL